jgi:hypothetical protein
MKRVDSDKKGVPRTPEQIERAQEVLAVVKDLLDFDTRAQKRVSLNDRYLSAALMFSWLAVRDANQELSRALWDAQKNRVAFVDPDIIDTVRRFRALGPARLRDLLRQKKDLWRQKENVRQNV